MKNASSTSAQRNAPHQFKLARLSAAVGIGLTICFAPLTAQTTPNAEPANADANDSSAKTKKATTADGKEVESLGAITVTGIRASVERAQDIKRDADTFVDSVTATDIGALPDRSVTETLSRIPGVTIDHFL